MYSISDVRLQISENGLKASQATFSDPALRAVALVTTINARLRRVSIHGVRRALLHARDSSRSPADSSRESDHVLHAASRWQRRRHIDTDVRDL